MSNSGGTNAHKDVMYIDVDDEITGIIDKVRGSSQKIVALVLPKRATVLQSIVNMKLLKRTADGTKKNIVLITSEAGLLPLAGNVGIHVAKTLNSKPEIPEAPDRDDSPDAIEEMSGPDEEDEKASLAAKDASVDRTKTVGELAGAAAVDNELDDTIDLDDEGEESSAGAANSSDKKTKGEKKNRKFKIPDFNRFRLILILAVVSLFLLGGFAYAAVAVLPKAKITIKTDSMSVNTSTVVELKVGTAVQLDVDKGIVPAQSQEVKKTMTQQVAATGQKNNGEKAVGSVTMTAKNCSSLSTPKDVPAGTGLTSGGKTYITQEKASFGGGTFDGTCLNFQDSNVAIAAQSGGAGFNVTSATFTVAGRSDASATGSTSGGTDDIIKIVIQADIDSAKQKIGEQDTEAIKQELKSGLIDRDLFAVDATFGSAEPETKLSTEANQPADNVTVTQTITYTMLGAKQADLEKVVEKEAKAKIDTKKQTIQSFGIDKAVFSLQTKNADGASVTMQAAALTGAELNGATIKKQIAGKKANDAKEIIKANPGVTDVKVEYSPFWVGSIPSNTSKITVVIQEPQVTTQDEQSSP